MEEGEGSIYTAPLLPSSLVILISVRCLLQVEVVQSLRGLDRTYCIPLLVTVTRALHGSLSRRLCYPAFNGLGKVHSTTPSI
jgi:hypothetical protein